jgi:pyruvate dehydrogenase E2 component (dihydrolipoamide acetyltransferase)
MSERPGIVPIRMPKWGLSMQEGQVVYWCKSAGDRFAEGEDLVEIETAKINNVFEAPTTGVLRKIVAAEGETVPVGGLLAVSAEADVSDGEVEAFVSEFQASFVPESDESEGQALSDGPVAVGPYQLNVGVGGAEDGQAVVLLHGFSSNAKSWEMNLPALTESKRVISVELPGHGASSKNVSDGSVEELARVVAAAIERLDVAGAHLVGHSLGGAVALQVAAADPSRFKSLVLIAPAGLAGSELNSEFLDAIVEAQRPRDLKPWLEMLFDDPALVSQEMVDDMARYKRIDGVEESLSAVRDGLTASRAAAPDALASLPPTLLVLGENDRIVSAPGRGSLPGRWRVETLEKAGHMPHVEQAAEFNRLLTDFLAENT